MTVDALRQFRAVQSELGDLADDHKGFHTSTCPVVIGKVVARTAVPTSTGVFFSVHVVRVGGPEVEGGAGVFQEDASDVLSVLLIGSTPPLAGDYLICRFVRNRWVGERMGSKSSTTVSVPGCTCQAMPPVLSLQVSQPSLSYGMLQSATLVYGKTPSDFARLSLGASCYLSSSSYNDQSTPDQFWYYFACLGGYYILTRVYKTSVYGSPYRDTIRYKWLVGNAGNSCKPFMLKNGLIYPGGDPLCIATIQ